MLDRQFDDPSRSYVKHITTFFNDHNLTQLIQEPTQARGHILDWIVVREDDTFVSRTSVNVMDVPFSDHKAVFCSLTAGGRPKREKRTIVSRNIKKIDTAQLHCDVKSLVESDIADCPDSELLDGYNSGLRNLFDRHAPLTPRRVTNRPSAPWMTDDVKAAKRELRKTERQWRKSRLTVHRQIFVKQRAAYTSCVRAAKKQHYSELISDCTSSKKLFSITNQPLGKAKSGVISSSTGLPQDKEEEDVSASY